MSSQSDSQKLEKIVNIMLEMTKIDNSNQLLEQLLKGALNLTTSANVSVMLLDHCTLLFPLSVSGKLPALTKVV
jgi:hypothetical protein